MPELPEVETIRLGIEQSILYQEIQSIHFSQYSLRIPTPRNASQKLLSSRLMAVGRRAKYLLFHFDNKYSLIIHLGMSGSIRIETKYQNIKHDHLHIHFSAEKHLIYNDPRRFGLVKLIPTHKIDGDKLLKNLGVEPLSDNFTFKYLKTKFSKSSKNIKTLLLDQSVICGIGNIYASEILFSSFIHPEKKVFLLSEKEITSLISAIKEVLSIAIQSGGASLNDYSKVDGSMGYFLHYAQVYGKKGLPCSRLGCLGQIQTLIQSGRSTFFCPNCQK